VEKLLALVKVPQTDREKLYYWYFAPQNYSTQQQPCPSEHFMDWRYCIAACWPKHILAKGTHGHQ
jgi:hypothetical protein